MSDEFDVSLCDNLEGAPRRICRGEIGDERVIQKIRNSLLSSIAGGAECESSTPIANEADGLRLNLVPPLTMGAHDADSWNNDTVSAGVARRKNMAYLAGRSHDNSHNGECSEGFENCDKIRKHSEPLKIAPVDVSGQPKVKTMTLFEKITSFVKTQAKSLATGLADQKVIDERLAICQQCPFLKDSHCQKCGCACGGGKKYLNKLAAKSAVCPDNPPRWGAVE